jgi:L-iditol 2-dehydrogenase
VYCGACWYCRRGEINLCDNRKVLGVSCEEYRRDGAYAEYVAVPQHILYRLPEAITFEQAAMVEPVSVAVHAVNRTPITLNDTGVVIGVGMIGMLALQALKLAGCGRVIAVDIDENRLKMAEQLGAYATFNANETDVAKKVKHFTGGRGADVAVEAVGLAETVNQAIECVRKGGAVTLVGNLAPSGEMPLQTIVTRQLQVSGSYASSGDFPACLELISRGDIEVNPLISATPALSEGAEWLKRLYEKEPGLMKVILKP